MYSQGVVSCCGAGILFGFPYDTYKDPTEKTELLLQEQIAVAKLRGYSYEGWGMLIAFTAPEQNQFTKLLRKYGFTRKAIFGNPVHGGRKLKLWTLDLNKVDLSNFTLSEAFFKNHRIEPKTFKRLG